MAFILGQNPEDLISCTDSSIHSQLLNATNGFVVAYQHINFKGEYDFSGDALKLVTA